nr:hypothetical protein [Acidobacteriota bacterium]
VPAGPPGTLRLIAVNTTAEPVSGVVQAYVDVPYESDEPRRVVDPGALDAPVRFWPKDAHIAGIATHDGQPAPFQVLSVEESRPVVMSRYETPWILRGRRHHVVWQGQVPACGYATFDAVFATTSVSPGAGATATDVRVDGRTAENEHVRIAINDDGTVDVEDKRSDVRYQRCGTLEDVGDVGDEYNYSPPATDRRITSADLTDVRITAGDAGPLRASFRIDGNLALPAAITPDRSRRSDEVVINAVSIIVTLDAGSPRVGWRIAIDNRSADHRLRLLFPTGVDEITEVRAETAFGVARRPARRERPEHVRMEVPVSYGPTASFTEAGSDCAGAILFGEGLSEYEAVPGDDGRVSTLALTLLRCVGYLSREDLVLRPSGHAGPGLATPGAQCPGRHEFHLAFEPRGDAPSNGTLFRRAASFATPPLVVPAVGAGGQQPATSTFLQIEAGPGDVVLSACHRAEEHDGIIVRMFNADETPAMVYVTSKTPVNAGAAVDFLERDRHSLPVQNGGVDAQVPPYGIVTMRMT